MPDPNVEAKECSRTPPSTLKPTQNSVTHADVGGLDVRFYYGASPPAPGSSDDDLKNFLKGLSPETSRDMPIHPSLEALVHPFVRNMNYFSSVYGTGYGKLLFIGWSHSYRKSLKCNDVKKDGTKVKEYINCAKHDNGYVPTTAGESVVGELILRGSYHYHAKALDIIWFAWEGSGGVPVYCRPHKADEDASDPAAYRRLVAVEAGLRKWFGYVLNRGIKGHADHFHVDNGCPLALRVRKGSGSWVHTSCHYFLQDCVRAFTDEEPDYDGAWGSASEHGYKTLLSDLGMECLDPVGYVNHYMLFLDYIMMHGFADASAGTYRWGDDALAV